MKFRMHIACAEAFKKNEPMPADTNVHVIIQRHAALAWVTMHREVMDEEDWGRKKANRRCRIMSFRNCS